MARVLHTVRWFVCAVPVLLICAHASAAELVDHDDAYIYRLPFADAQSYAVIQSWGSPLSHTGAEHYTIDFRMPVGTPVHAAREGTVVAIEERHTHACWYLGCGYFANYVAVEHDDGSVAEYFHLQRDGVLVAVGETVRRGQQIALSGNTGYSSVPHLHFGVYIRTIEGRRRSIDVLFATSGGIVRQLRSGTFYSNAAQLSVASR